MADLPTRRSILQTSGSLLLVPAARSAGERLVLNPVAMPAAATLFAESGRHALTRKGAEWRSQQIDLTTDLTASGLTLKLRSPNENRCACTFAGLS